MIKHIVIWKLKENAAGAGLEENKAKFKQMIPYKPIKVTNKKTKKINKAIWRKPSNKPISISNKKISRSKLV